MEERSLKKYGVKKLLESASGREYLAAVRKQHEIDLLQPSDPRFKKVYGAKIEADQKLRQRNETISKDMWAERKARKEWEDKHR